MRHLETLQYGLVGLHPLWRAKEAMSMDVTDLTIRVLRHPIVFTTDHTRADGSCFQWGETAGVRSLSLLGIINGILSRVGWTLVVMVDTETGRGVGQYLRRLETYLLFAGENYYPEGGVEDFQGAFTTLEAAKAAHRPSGNRWAHVAVWTDSRFEIVARTKYVSSRRRWEWT